MECFRETQNKKVDMGLCMLRGRSTILNQWSGEDSLKWYLNKTMKEMREHATGLLGRKTIPDRGKSRQKHIEHIQGLARRLMSIRKWAQKGRGLGSGGEGEGGEIMQGLAWHRRTLPWLLMTLYLTLYRFLPLCLSHVIGLLFPTPTAPKQHSEAKKFIKHRKLTTPSYRAAKHTEHGHQKVRMHYQSLLD